MGFWFIDFSYKPEALSSAIKLGLTGRQLSNIDRETGN